MNVSGYLFVACNRHEGSNFALHRIAKTTIWPTYRAQRREEPNS